MHNEINSCSYLKLIRKTLQQRCHAGWMPIYTYVCLYVCVWTFPYIVTNFIKLQSLYNKNAYHVNHEGKIIKRYVFMYICVYFNNVVFKNIKFNIIKKLI